MHFSKRTEPDPSILSTEFSLRQEKVWIQLEKKIDRPRRTRSFAWLAAACTVGIAAFTIWQLANGEKEPAYTSASIPATPAKIETKEQPTNTMVTNNRLVRKKQIKAHVKLQDPVSSKESKASGLPTILPQAEPVLVQQITQVMPAEIQKQIPGKRFRVAHINELEPKTNPSIARKFKIDDPITQTEPTIAEINDMQIPVKPKGMFGLLRTNQ